MKELEAVPKIEISQEQQQKKLKLVRNQSLKPGHKCWELNLITLEIQEAKFQKTTVIVDPLAINNPGLDLNEKRIKLIMNENCLYFNGLNKKSAIKQFNKIAKEAEIEKMIDL